MRLLVIVNRITATYVKYVGRIGTGGGVAQAVDLLEVS